VRQQRPLLGLPGQRLPLQWRRGRPRSEVLADPHSGIIRLIQFLKQLCVIMGLLAFRSVIPAKAGIHVLQFLVSRLRGNDEEAAFY